MSEQSSILNDASRKQDSDSIVRGILSNSGKYNHDKSTGDTNLTFERILNGSNSSRSPSTIQHQTKVGSAFLLISDNDNFVFLLRQIPRCFISNILIF